MKKAFTLVEIMIIISIIGILSAGIVSFLSDTERRKMLHAESCLNEMNASIKNFTNAAMTSKQLKLNSTDKVFPDYYFIEFQPSTSTSSWTITFKYETTNTSWTYQTLNLHWGCRRENISFDFATGTTGGVIKMNSGFRQLKPDELFSFSFLSGNVERMFVAEIPVNVCLDETCSKEFFKWVIDTRSQGIFTKKCFFYSENNPLKCETREGDNITT